MVDAAAAAALLACVALLVSIGRRVAVATDTPTELALVAAAVLLGVLACDFAAGAVHWACDRFFSETTPVLGPAVIASFREHHRDPLAMTRRGFLDVNGSNYLAVLPFLTYSASDAAPDGGWPLFGDAFVLALATAALLTNQLHKWAHAPDVPSPVRWLQRAHLVLPPAVHARHHAGAHGTSYCVTGGWLNPMLDRLGVFPRLERGIRAGARALAAVARAPQAS
jgi:ubiquitin-conjugating enzyme E2 variant